MIPDDVIEQVRDSADLVGLIGESVNLKRTGSDYRGPCPFHGGKNRNFAVIPKRGMYYCFVCHESGDVFRWLRKRLGMDYPAAQNPGGPTQIYYFRCVAKGSSLIMIPHSNGDTFTVTLHCG